MGWDGRNKGNMFGVGKGRSRRRTTKKKKKKKKKKKGGESCQVIID
jgi:hypothetical protein